MLKKPLDTSLREISVGARSSLLSKKQVEEVHAELKIFYPNLIFTPIYVQTMGDCDKKTSLRHMEKTDFFTREIDQMLLKGVCRIGIHSAKDLPDPLPQGIILGALTKGVDPSDVLVMRENESLLDGGVVATSSLRREECVKQLFPHVSFVDIRGTIQERLAQLTNKQVDGVVIAEAALIRLGLTHLHRVFLPGNTAPLQGRLAVTARAEDIEIQHFLRAIHS